MTIPFNGGCTFAERPEVEAPDARIIWRADMDPGALSVHALPADADHPDAIDAGALAPWLSIVADGAGEHVVLSDGWHRIRIDIELGSLAAGRPVVFHYQLHGIPSAEPKMLPLRRLFDLYRRRRFSASLYPYDPRVARWLLALRVHDAVTAGASQREISNVVFGGRALTISDAGRRDSMRSRVRRLAVVARQLAAGGYRALLRQRV